MQQVIDLLGKNVNFIRNIKFKQDFISENINGIVTDVVLKLSLKSKHVFFSELV